MRIEYTPAGGECDKIWPDILTKEPGTMKAEKTTVNWDAAKKQWHVRLQIGEEVIKGGRAKTPQQAPADPLRSRAVETAKDEGYEVDAAQVAIQR
jgi:hypothetical protein